MAKKNNQTTEQNQDVNDTYIVAIGMIHEDGKAYYNGQPITLTPDRANVRLADGSVKSKKD